MTLPSKASGDSISPPRSSKVAVNGARSSRQCFWPSASRAHALDVEPHNRPGHRGTQHKLQFHHIFPKAVLKGLRSTREIDEISNLAFIGGRTNRQISHKPPIQYLRPLIEKLGPAPFEAQCIPVDPGLLELDAYNSFLAERRKLGSARLNQFLAGSD